MMNRFRQTDTGNKENGGARKPARTIVWCVALLAIATLLVPSLTWACAGAFPPDQPVYINRERAIIVWDAKHHLEHFVRSAQFTTQSRDFGFLVPTPTTPKFVVAPAAENIFNLIPKPQEPPFLGGFGGGEMPGAASPVTVVKEEYVGGYDVVVLQASDPIALGDWLHRHGYAERAALTEWLAPYVRAGWKINAFKIANKKGGSITTMPVRMSFHTPRPFFPYREPTDQSNGNSSGVPHQPRVLEIAFLSNARVAGELQSASGDHANLPQWAGQTTWAKPLSEDDRHSAAYLELKGSDLPRPCYMTAFVDKSSPRPGVTDLYFSRAKVQEPQNISLDRPSPPTVKREANGVTPLLWAGGGAAVTAVMGGLLFALWRRRR